MNCRTYVSISMFSLIAFVAAGAPNLDAQTTFNVFAGDSIQNVINGAASGDTILVNDGTYTENLDFGGRELSLRSVGGAGVTSIAVNGGTGVTLSGASQLLGFTISGALNTFGAGVEVGGDGTLIQGNIFENNVQSAGGFGAGIGGNNASPIINQNIFRNNTSGSQFLSGVVSFINGSSPLITNNIFDSNDSRAINLTLPSGSNPRVINNTFVNNEVGIRVDRRIDSESYEIRNNILFENGIGVEVDFGIEANNPTFENNLVFGNDIDYDEILPQTGMNGNIAVDPGLVDAINGDFRLLSNSLAIDAGSDLDAPLFDFANNPRPIGGQIDIGAFEAVPEPSSAIVVASLFVLVSTRRRRR